MGLKEVSKTTLLDSVSICLVKSILDPTGHMLRTPQASAHSVSGHNEFLTLKTELAHGCCRTWREGLHALCFLFPVAVVKVFLFNWVNFIPVLLQEQRPNELIGSSSTPAFISSVTRSLIMPVGPGASMMSDREFPSPGPAWRTSAGRGCKARKGWE